MPWASRLTIAFLSAIVVVAGPLTPCRAGSERVALVIGNGAYKFATRLPNPPNDAADMSAALRSMGFEVIGGSDLDRRAMEDKIRTFGDKLDTATIALFFYAGHGMQIAGKNYLIPIDAKLQRPGDLTLDTVDLQVVLDQMESRPRVNLVFLDACRNNPLARSFASTLGASRSTAVGQGLAAIQSAVGTMIAFATEPDKVALDGTGRNSPFTAALLKHIRDPGVDVSVIMRNVRKDVLASTGGQQLPWDHSSLTDAVILTPAAVGSPRIAEPAPPAEGPAQVAALTPAPSPAPLEELVRQANAASDQKNYSEAIGLYRRAADQGNAEAQNHLGDLYREGKGVERDYAEALRWFRKAADQGFAWAQVNVGEMYRGGLGVRSDYAEAMRLFREAADQGNAGGQNGVGVLYQFGLGVGQDYPEAMRWFRKAADQGQPWAQSSIGSLYRQGLGVGRDYAAAMTWYRKAADQANPAGRNGIGVLFENGLGVERNYDEALKWYRLAAGQDFAWAEMNVGYMYAYGRGLEKDCATAVQWFEKAAAAHIEGVSAFLHANPVCAYPP